MTSQFYRIQNALNQCDTAVLGGMLAAASRPSDKALRAQILAALHPLHDPARLGTVESFRTLSKVTP